MTLDLVVFEQLENALQQALFVKTISPATIPPGEGNDSGQAEAIDNLIISDGEHLSN